MADDVYDVCNDEEEIVLPEKPAKHFALFFMNENEGYFPKDIADGSMGPLPLLLGVNVGYDPEEEDPFMKPYESQEILFAYKKGAQQRILLQNKNNRTYSLPVESKVPFCLNAESKEEMTISEILQKHQLPLFGVQFARPDRVEFRVDRQQQVVDSSYFGPLTLTRVYEEPYLYCLSIAGGVPDPVPRVLPRNLKDVCFAPIVKVRGVTDSSSKLQEFKDKFSNFAEEMDYQEDPFFKELALVSEGPGPVEGEPQPYIENTTFIPITYHRRPVPDLPSAPILPNRQPLTPVVKDADPGWNTTAYRSQEWESLEEFDHHYMPLIPGSKIGDEHIYTVPQDHPDGEDSWAPDCDRLKSQPRSQVVRPMAKVEAYNADKKNNGDSLDRADVIQVVTSEVASDKKWEPPQALSGVSLMFPPPPPPPPPPSRSTAHSHSPSTSSPTPPPLPPSRHRQGPSEVGALLSLEERTAPRQAEVVAALTVEKVVQVLKQLGLGKYSRQFKAHMIDGRILAALSSSGEVLVKDFGMSQVEVIKLQKYVTEGHIPQTDSMHKSRRGLKHLFH